jgi:hypothetical protein
VLGDSGLKVGQGQLEGTDCEEFEGPCVEGSDDEVEVLDAGGGKSLHGEIGFDKFGSWSWSVEFRCAVLRFDGENDSVRLSRTDNFSAVDSMKWFIPCI